MIIKHVTDIVQGKASIGQKRSSKWPTVRKHHLETNPTCAVCNGTDVLEVHHIKPYHVHPELELDPINLITLCESKSYGIVCHRAIGHLGDYKKTNTSVIEDSVYWNKRLSNR